MAYSLVKDDMARSTLRDLFPDLDTWSVGFDREWRLLDELQNMGRISSYPPYNIKQTGDNSYQIEMAVAGFEKKDLHVEMNNNRLIVEGSAETKKDKTENEYIYKGIASRHFRQSFALANHVKVKNSELKNGILRIELESEVPLEMKPRTIEIK